jgi:FkbM family methyltransferase
MEYYSQCKQDFILETQVFKNYKNGLFMDIGAHDGVTINNTLYFEKNNNWKGTNVEPIKNVYDKLVINRPNSLNINCAVDNYNGTAEFICNTGYTEMLSGLKNNYDQRHLNRMVNELKQMGGNSEIIMVDVKTIESICNEHNIKNINYLSIDVEGGEFNVIKSINFDTVFIDVIGFENNFDDVSTPIIEYLQNKDYKLLYKSTDVFMIHKKSQFFLHC